MTILQVAMLPVRGQTNIHVGSSHSFNIIVSSCEINGRELSSVSEGRLVCEEHLEVTKV